MPLFNPVEASESAEYVIPQAEKWAYQGALNIPGTPGEACVLYHDGIFKLWYSVGGSDSRIAYATSPNGFEWTEQGEVVGGGAGDWAGKAARCNVVEYDGILYMTFSDLSNDPSGNIRMVTSVDGETWENETLVFTRTTADQWGNRRIEREGSVFRMFAEKQTPGLNQQNIALYTSNSPAGPWTLVKFPLTSLQEGIIAGTSSTSPGGFKKIGDIYHAWVWCGQGYGDFNGTEVYHSTSRDLVNWSQPQHLWRAKDTTFEGSPVIQHADICVLEHNNRCYFYYTIVTTGAPVGIGFRFYDGPLSDVVEDPVRNDQYDLLPKSISTGLSGSVTPDYYNPGVNNFAWVFRRFRITGFGGYSDSVHHVEGILNIISFTTHSLQLCDGPLTANSTISIRLQGGVNGWVTQQIYPSGNATSITNPGTILVTNGSGVASGKFRYRFSANFAASAGDVIVMSPSGHTFVVDENVTNATAFTSEIVGGVTVRSIQGGTFPTTSDTSLTVNGGAPIATTFQINSATGTSSFSKVIVFYSSTGVHIYSPAFGAGNVHYMISGG